MNKRITTAVAVYLILERQDGQILMMRRYNTGYQDGMYQTAAGHLDDDELPLTALVRETKEEVGISIKREDAELVHVSARPRHDETGNRLDMFFRVRRWEGEPRIVEKNKCDDMTWCSPDNLPVNTTPHVREGIKLAMQGIFYSEFDHEWIDDQPEYGAK